MPILLMIGILIAAGCGMETTPGIVILAPRADTIGMAEIQFCILMIPARAVSFVFFMLLMGLMIACIPTFSTTLLPDIH